MTRTFPKIERTLDDVADAKRRGDVTTNGVAYFTDHGTSSFHFILAREAHHTDADLHTAKVELHKGREDRTSLRFERFDPEFQCDHVLAVKYHLEAVR